MLKLSFPVHLALEPVSSVLVPLVRVSFAPSCWPEVHTLSIKHRFDKVSFVLTTVWVDGMGISCFDIFNPFTCVFALNTFGSLWIQLDTFTMSDFFVLLFFFLFLDIVDGGNEITGLRVHEHG